MSHSIPYLGQYGALPPPYTFPPGNTILPVAQVKELGDFLSLLSSPIPLPVCQQILTTPHSKCTLNQVTPSKATTLAPETIVVLP